MEIIKKERLNLLIPEERKQLIDKEQNKNEEPYYFKKACIPKNMTLEECKEKFVEVEENA